ncbi:MAG: signal peptidase I [Proteobacteria bacterium]|nr:signal peptidase I [Pseudomonadota bacterium]
MHKESELAKTSSKSFLQESVDFIKSILIFLGIAFMLRASVVEAFKIPSSSMEPTLDIGDHILVNKLSYGFRFPFVAKTVFDYSFPDRGDVVVFTLPEDSDTNIIKRVIGLPGDKIQVTGTKVFINDQFYSDDERYAQWVSGGKVDFGPVIVPPGRVLLMGDNRDQSQDSRFWPSANKNIGEDGKPSSFLDTSRIKGRAFVIYWNSAFKFDHLFNGIK